MADWTGVWHWRICSHHRFQARHTHIQDLKKLLKEAQDKKAKKKRKETNKNNNKYLLWESDEILRVAFWFLFLFFPPRLSKRLFRVLFKLMRPTVISDFLCLFPPAPSARHLSIFKDIVIQYFLKNTDAEAEAAASSYSTFYCCVLFVSLVPCPLAISSFSR